MKRIILLMLILIIVVSAFSQTSKVPFLKSIVVPGWGQLSSGRDYGYAMLAGEVAIIGSMLYLGTEQKLSKQEAYEYAMEFAHIRPGDYEDTYLGHLSHYDSSGYGGGGYNAHIRELAIENYPNDPIMQQQYIDNNIYSDEMAWNWDSSGDRGTYSKMRIHTQDLKDFSKIAVGVMILNHLVSGIDALRFGKDNNSGLSIQMRGDRPVVSLDISF
ncbi:MAG TPA: hypothetical protein PL124_00180 [Candidatus Cloacimonadota bacterium]|nr:hypothetical protein [Candidatus Cloacimonadota bacterium]